MANTSLDDVPALTQPAAQQLNQRQQLDYTNYRKTMLLWLLYYTARVTFEHMLLTWYLSHRLPRPGSIRDEGAHPHHGWTRCHQSAPHRGRVDGRDSR